MQDIQIVFAKDTHFLISIDIDINILLSIDFINSIFFLLFLYSLLYTLFNILEINSQCLFHVSVLEIIDIDHLIDFVFLYIIDVLNDSELTLIHIRLFFFNLRYTTCIDLITNLITKSRLFYIVVLTYLLILNQFI